MRPAAAFAAAAALPRPARACTFDAGKGEAWLARQGCADGNISSCPGGQTPPQGCSDAVYTARLLAAGGAVPGLDADNANQWDYVFYMYKGVRYILDQTTGLQDFLTATGWKKAESPAASAPRGAIAFIDAWSGEPCYAHGGDSFYCHTPPIIGGPHCAVPSSQWAACCPTLSVWTCTPGPVPPVPPATKAPPATPTPPTMPPAPPPAPGACKAPGDWLLESRVCNDSSCAGQCQRTLFPSGECIPCGDSCSFSWCCPADGSAPVLTTWGSDGACGGAPTGSVARAAGTCSPDPVPFTAYRCVAANKTAAR